MLQYIAPSLGKSICRARRGRDQEAKHTALYIIIIYIKYTYNFVAMCTTKFSAGFTDFARGRP